MSFLSIIDGNKPHKVGTYVVYTNGPVLHVAERMMLFWDGTCWSYLNSDQRYRDHIYGYIGPLPVLTLENDDGKR